MNQLTDTEHQEVWDLLPWLVTGRLSDAERGRMEAHLQACSACRDECTIQRQIHTVVAADASVEQMPTAGLNKLRRRLDDAVESESPPHPADTPMRRASHRIRASRLRAGAIAASLIVFAIGVGIPAAHYWRGATRQGEAAPYYTVTTAASQHPDAVIRAVFSPTLTVSELQALLAEAHLTVVSGPTDAGVYSLAMSGTQSLDWSLQRLRARDVVRFAEPVAVTPMPAPAP